MEKILWTTEKRKLTDLIPAKYNPRKSTDIEYKQLETSLEKFSLADPLVVNKNNTVIGGHFRLKVLQAKGVQEIDVRLPSRLLDENEERELNLRLNKNLGLWDYDALADFDEDMLADVGFDSKELDKVFQLDASEADDAVPDARPTTDIKLGDIFTLGEHRLMCGDSTKREDVDKLMQEKKADMVFTSPPYNMGKSSKLDRHARTKDNLYNEYNDNISTENYSNFLNNFFLIWIDKAEYICINFQLLAGNKKSLFNFINRNIDYFCDVGIWNKNGMTPAMAENVMNSSFEFLFFFTKENANRAIRTAQFRGTVNNVFDITKQKKNEYHAIHGATFPVELPEKIIETFTQRNMIIADPFSGTGSTLIACEKTSRVCYGMEIDPIYCQVIIDRWETFTGKKAEKLNV